MNDIERLKIVVQDRDYLSEEDFQAIENVLAELNKKDGEIAFLNLAKISLETQNEDLKDELETYKKIAEKLAEEIDNYDTYNENDKYCQFDYGFCMLKDKKCVDCIIEWARKEVEKDGI